MGEQQLAQFASGLTGSLFGGIFQDRQAKQDKEDKDLARQLAAYHALLEHPDTPESEIPNILDAQAELLKVGPKFKGVTDHMRQAMQQQVPNGPERETAQSGANRTVATSTAIQPTTDTLATGLNPRPTNATPTSPGTVPMLPDAAPQTITTPALSVVPPEPQMYQPTKAYGEMTQGEAADFRKSQTYIAQQKAMLDRQSELARINGDHAEEMAAQRAKANLELQEQKNAGRIAAVEKTYEEKKKALGPYDTAAAAAADKQRLALELQLRAGGMDPTEAKERSGAILSSNMEAILDQHKAKAERDRAEIGHWRAIDPARILAAGSPVTAGLTRLELAQMRNEGGAEIQGNLGRIDAELIKQQSLRSNANGTKKPGDKDEKGNSAYDATYDARITELENAKTAELLKLKSLQQSVIARRPSPAPRVPSVPGAAASSAPANAGSFDMRGWSQSHPNATEAERNAIRSKARARNLAVVE